MGERERTFYMITLGCPKNEVDSDCLAATLINDGWRMVDRPAQASVMVVNTCSFIAAAVEESIETVLELADLRDGGRRPLVVAGCLVSRYGGSSLRPLLPEVDLFVDFPAYPRFATLVASMTGAAGTRDMDPPRRECASTMPRGYIYVKISEGCARRCAFCAIPSIRGPLRSRPRQDIREEVSFFVDRGACEIILVAQDTTSYGLDTAGRPMLPELLRELCAIEGDWRLRVMYMHPEGVDGDLLKAMRDPRICRYLDLPLQHVNDGVLRGMGRKGDVDSQRRLLCLIGDILGETALRATFMVGFPGEDGAAYGELRDFVAESRFDWVGLFGYSHEEGTPAFSLERGVSGEVARARLDELTAIQEEIMRENAREQVGRNLRVLVECKSDEAAGFWEARSQREAPEIDGVIFVAHREDIRPGSMRNASITANEGIDLVGHIDS